MDPKLTGNDDLREIIGKYGFLDALLAILMTFLLLTVFVQVVLRYATYQPLAWTEELARLLFIWVCMIGAAVAAKRGAHFSVTLIFDVVPLRIIRGLKIALRILEAAFYSVLTYSAVAVTRVASRQYSPSLEYPMSLPYSVFAISGGLMCLFALQQALIILRRRDI